MPSEEEKHKGGAKKRTISEEDVSLLLKRKRIILPPQVHQCNIKENILQSKEVNEDQKTTIRYSANTILALLQEVSRFSGPKIDWKSLVKRSSSGITNAREYQMLWRHLAYYNTLLEKIDDVEPLDDDSDLEFDIEAVPAVSKEASIEATACVKVLISSGSQVELSSINRSTVEAPLTINIPNDCVSHAPLDKEQDGHCNRGRWINIPVFVPKQSLQTGPSLEDKMPAKKRRKAWTKVEDMKLIAAVQKCGEGNWANILKGDFKHERTVSQLSQRWSIIRKSQAKYRGIGNKSSNSTRSEERLAAQKAISLAIDMPMSRSLSTVFSGATLSSAPASSTIAAPLSEALPVSAPPTLAQPQQAGATLSSAPASSTIAAPLSEAPVVSAPPTLSPPQASKQATSQKGTSNSLTKPRNPPKKPAALLTPSTCPNSSIKAAAFAAGGRLAAPSTAASLLKAAQSKTAVRIRPIGGALPKSSGTGAKLLPGINTLGTPQNLGPPSQQAQPVHTQPNSRIAVPRHGGQQGPEKLGALSSSICPLVSNQLAKSETRPGKLAGTASQENGEVKFGSIISAVDLDELLTEEDADMELEDAAEDNQTGLRCMDVNENEEQTDDSHLKNQALIDANIGFYKSGSSESHTAKSKAKSAEMHTAENQDLVIDAGGSLDEPKEG